MTIQTGAAGKLVSKVLVAQDVFYPGASEPKEYYMSVLLDRATKQNVIIYTTEGGMDIEEVAEQHPEKIHKEWVNPAVGLQAFQARKIAFNLGLEGKAFKEMVTFVTALYRAYDETDSAMFEINPVLKTSDDRIIAVDAKVNLDDNALYRHKDFLELRDLAEEDPTEVEAGKFNLNYVKLDGNVGCMVNGAGLAMATMDIIKLSGGEPANFLDVGGTANAETVENGFRIIMSDPNVKAILINIFGGIRIFYAITKKTNELMSYVYSYNFLVPTTGIRFFTIYGPFGRPDMSILKFIKLILLKKKINLYNFGKNYRDFTYIDDVITRLSNLISKPPKIRKSKNNNNFFPPYRILNFSEKKGIYIFKLVSLLEKLLKVIDLFSHKDSGMH